MVSDQTERMQILDMIESGKISADDGLILLKALVDNQAELEEDVENEIGAVDAKYAEPDLRSSTVGFAEPAQIAPNLVSNSDTRVAFDEKMSQNPPIAGGAEAYTPEQAKPVTLEPNKWKNFWMIPFWIGAAILIAGGVLMYRAITAAGVGFGFILASLPFILGLLIVIFAWQSRTSPWIHLRITQAPGEKPQHIALSFPLPIRPAMWFFRVFGDKIPKVQEISLDKILLAVDQSASADNPVYIQVDEGEQGEKVEIYIG